MILLALLLAANVEAEAPRGARFTGRELDAKTDDVGALLRCPVCQGLSVTDSPSTMARNMKAEVREKLAAGYDEEQILASFEKSYGEFVRLEPPVRGVNWLVWLGPIALLLGGGALIARTLRRPREAATLVSDAPPSRDAVPDDAELSAAVRRVREMAYGWPDGLSPKSAR